jgi:hypothetical protein
MQAAQSLITSLLSSPLVPQALIATEVDRLEPLLYPLLRRDLGRAGPRAAVAIGALCRPACLARRTARARATAHFNPPALPLVWLPNHMLAPTHQPKPCR